MIWNVLRRLLGLGGAPDVEVSAAKDRAPAIIPNVPFRIDSPPPPPLPKAAAAADAAKPEWIRSDAPIYYTYVHRDQAGEVFYVGMGHDDWAWAPKSGLWKKYVDERSGGQFDVEIVHEDLYIDEAARKKDALLRKHAKTVVNIQTPYRETNYKAWERFHKLRDANRKFVADTKGMEGVDTDAAITRYRAALEAMHEYANIKAEGGLVGELQHGSAFTEIVILDRLTLCLSRLRRFQELMDECNRYFARYPHDRDSAVGRTILKRFEKARLKL